MNRTEAIHELVKQIEQHCFYHLYRNRRTVHHGQGWSGALNLFSLNTENAPNPAGHFEWLQNKLTKIIYAQDHQQNCAIANQILEWGGMPLRINNAASETLLNQVVAKAVNWELNNNAPMNSSWTKIASVFGYLQGNTSCQYSCCDSEAARGIPSSLDSKSSH